MAPQAKQIVVAVTGASGAAYARSLIGHLTGSEADVRTHLIVSPHGKMLLADELGIRRITPETLAAGAPHRLILHDYQDIGCELASGSFPVDGMVICPCSSNTLGAIAAGLGANLITRAAHVTLKERRRLILLHREMPLSEIDIENMLRISRAGGVICPAAPGFYMQPESVDDLVDFVVGRLLDLLHVPHNLNTRWTGQVPTIRPAANQ